MTTISVINTGSNGNGYILRSDNQTLIIELGYTITEFVRQMDVDEYLSLQGCIVSHLHSDHFNKRTTLEFKKRGINMYVGNDVYDTIEEDIIKDAVIRISDTQKTTIGGYLVQPFKTPHNVPNYGFLVITPTKERIVFVTDTQSCEYNFKNIDCLMVECNHDNDTLLDNLLSDEYSSSHPEYHMGLDKCTDFCKRNASISTKEIILIHMSHTNINEEESLKVIKNATMIEKVSFAHRGDIYCINTDNF